MFNVRKSEESTGCQRGAGPMRSEWEGQTERRWTVAGHTSMSPAFSIRPNGKISRSNAAARRLYNARGGDHVDEVSRLHEDLDGLSLAFVALARSNRQQALRLRICGQPGPILGMLVPLRQSDPRAEDRAVFVGHRIIFSDLLRTILMETFGLTGAELDIVEKLASGFSAQEISHVRGSSLFTTRSQVRAIYEKTYVTSQVRLMQLILGVQRALEAVS